MIISEREWKNYYHEKHGKAYEIGKNLPLKLFFGDTTSNRAEKING